MISFRWIFCLWDTNCSEPCIKRLEQTSAIYHRLGCFASWTLICEVQVCFLFLSEHVCINVFFISQPRRNVLNLLSVSFSLFIIVHTLFLRKVLISRISQRWKPVINYILLSINIMISSNFIFLNRLISNSINPSFVFVAIFTVSVAVVGDIVVDGGFY